MSVVLAVKDGNRIVMGADCQVTRGAKKLTLISPNEMKIWELESHKNMIMGGSGSLRDINIVSTMGSLYDPLYDKAKEEIDFKFVVRHIVPEIMNELGAFARTTQGEHGLVMGSLFLLAKDDMCYQIDHDGCVSELVYDGEAMAIGSGADVAYSAYNALADIEDMPVEEKIIRAVGQACADDLYVNYPIIIKSTDKTDQTIIFDGVESYLLGVEEDELEEIVEEVVEDGVLEAPETDN